MGLECIFSLNGVGKQIFQMEKILKYLKSNSFLKEQCAPLSDLAIKPTV